MTSSLSKELNKFFRHSQRLRAILEETKQCFEEINSSGKYDGAQIVTAELLREEEAEVLATVEKPPALIIIGQTAYAKSRIINEIFGQTIYPILDDTDDDKSFRMVRFKHGDTSCFSLTLDEFDVVDTLEAYNGPFNIIPKKYLETTNGIVRHDNAHELATLEVTLNHPLLNYDCQVIIFPSNLNNTPEDLMKKLMETFTPILVYGFLSTGLSEEEKKELKEIRKITDHLPCFFVQCPDPGSEGTDTDPPDGTPSSSSNQILRIALQVDKHISNISSKQLTKRKHSQDAQCSDSEQKVHLSDNGLNKVYQLLGDVGYFPDDARINNMTLPDYREPESEFLLTFEDFPKRFSQFTQKMLQCYLINSATILNNSHSRCINMFIMSAFDMARDMMITPKKLEFARSKEEELYKSLLQITISKHDEIKSIIIDTIKSMHDEILLKALEYDFIGVDFDETGKILTAKGLKICTWQIQEFLLSQLNRIIAGKLVNSINVMRDSYTGTLTRCLESLESTDEESPDSNKTTDALKQILNAAYQVEITITSSSSLIRVLLEKMRQFVQSLPWKTPPRIDDDWKKKMASETLSSLSEARLAKSISSQIKERLNKSHEAFGLALKQLDLRHTGRLDKIEEERLKLRKYHAPKVAKLALESTSLKDVILHGIKFFNFTNSLPNVTTKTSQDYKQKSLYSSMPQIGKEVGRGQYGVVYSCDNWAGFSPCAIKSVVPPDDKHWNDLAMEFYYTRHVPDHDRIVSLRGSVIDYNYGGGSTPAVLLVMERLQKDLYTAIKLGLDWPSRLQVAIDVEEGIRFLHSRGLVHRDIKLKNVLLDRDNRGKITDLGFCKPEAMMSGSIVGTPIHMAPELFSGRYDNSVDVYAFGILFWYVCAGSVKLPQTFEQCANKDQLWTSVKKGLRPEKLSVFDEECWKLMECCWQGEPARRPLLGDVELALKSISKRFPSLPPNKVAASGQKVGASTPRDIKNIVGRFSQRT